MPRSTIAAALLCLASTIGHAQADLISLRLWCELEPMVQENEEYPLSTEAARRRGLEEARLILSAMIYGFHFRYTPADRLRQIEEEFTLIPVAEIPWGDPNMRVTDAYVEDSLLFLKIQYRLQEFQFARRRAWASNSVQAGSGVGSHSVFTSPSPEGKRQAFEEAMKNAVREALTPVHFNKPREVTGEILLWSEPQTIIQSGAYTTRVDVKLRIKEIRPYSLF
jgi:hypothetical protein